MTCRNKFDVLKLKGKPAELRDWMRNHHVPPRLLFILIGIFSTVWFLVRVIPKPSRATYPCMRVAAPFMSGFVVYILGVLGVTIASRRMKRNILNVRYVATAMLVFGVIITMAMTPSASSFQDKPVKMGPDDGPNQPFGKAVGVKPGRVVWAWDPKATNENCINTFDFYKPQNTNQGVVNRMVVQSVTSLTGKSSLRDSWDALFRNFNIRKKKGDKGYVPGEKIFIKINQGTANANIRKDGRENGYYFSKDITEAEGAANGTLGTCETYPNVVLELLRELVYVAGVDQKDISIGDPISHIFGHNYEVWATEFPNVKYLDKFGERFGRTPVKPTEKDLLFYSDKTQTDKLYDYIENADYMINVANLKAHGRAGISLTAKNHFGSQGRNSAFHLHYSLISPVSLGDPSNNGYHKYRVLVDLMGSKYLGQNTLLFVVDGLYGGGSNETKAPVKYMMYPFNNDWANSIFISQDQVALESVCYDFLRNEWNGINKHSAANNAYESLPNVNGVDDYLHQAADPANWPKGLVYDPDNSGKPLPSLGVHEHWNNAVNKQYSRNLGKQTGIELVAIPDSLVGSNVKATVYVPQSTDNSTKVQQDPVANTTTTATTTSTDVPATKNVTNVTFSNKTFTEGMQARKFHSVTVDDANTKWFLTESGLVSFDGKTWVTHNKNRKVSSENLKDVEFDISTYGKELWIATPQGATVATLPVDARTGATTYYSQNSTIVSDNVLSVAMGKSPLRWFGTDKGISAFYNRKWLKNTYQRKYPDALFKDYPITAMATSPDGDSLYVATDGAGVARVYRDSKVDAVSGASEYAQWGPIEIPSDKVYSICIEPDGTQWFGTDMGVGRHKGYNTLEEWTVFNKESGLIDNFVQSIGVDKDGKKWFGTKSGLSVFDGSTWKSYTTADGLSSNNILCITMDKKGVLWLGTDNGVISFSNGEFICYK
jgi:hypothetical protein